MTQGRLCCNRSRLAWYCWRIGADSGEIRRQAMVAAGHFMLTHYFDRDVRMELLCRRRLPVQALERSLSINR